MALVITIILEAYFYNIENSINKIEIGTKLRYWTPYCLSDCDTNARAR